MHSIGFKIQSGCGMCAHGKFSYGSSWGTCKVFSYEHLKHSKSSRELSVHSHGICKDEFTWNSASVLLIGKYEEFMD